MNKYQGTQTEKNLMEAFAGESQARNKYTYFSSVAKKEGCTPQDVCDRYHNIIKDSFKEFGISFDIYSRTTSETHQKVASDFFRTLYDKGAFIEKESEQYYDEEAKTFLADRYITGECPRHLFLSLVQCSPLRFECVGQMFPVLVGEHTLGVAPPSCCSCKCQFHNLLSLQV